MLYRFGIPQPEVLENSLHDQRVVDESDDAHLVVTLGALYNLKRPLPEYRTLKSQRLNRQQWVVM